MTNSQSANCLCGAVSLTANSINDHFEACHCSICRKWGGGPLLAIDCGSDVSITGEKSLTAYKSSDWAERGFCNQCGTHLFYRLKHADQYIVPVGLFGELTDIPFTKQIFIDEKPATYCFANETDNLTGEQVFAQAAQAD